MYLDTSIGVNLIDRYEDGCNNYIDRYKDLVILERRDVQLWTSKLVMTIVLMLGDGDEARASHGDTR